jgi:hypothetical protein
VLVLEPGTSAGSGYFVPFAKWVVSKAKGWQIWSVERRENLLEDQTVLNQSKQRKATSQQVFDYYLGWLTDSSIKNHFQLIPDSSVGYARQWGLNVAMQDLHRVIGAAKRLGGKVVLGGHSRGASMVTAYATWDFHGKPGADGLSGLVYDDGGSLGAPVSAEQATQSLQTLQTSSPWTTGGAPAPYVGLFGTAGALGAVLDPDSPSLGQTWPLLPPAFNAPVRVTNLALFGYDTDTKTSKLVFAFQAHLGQLDTSKSPAGWSRAGAITPIKRWASMLSGPDLRNADGVEWYFPQRLVIDIDSAINEGNANPAQGVLDVKATHGRDLPRKLRIYAFGAYGGKAITGAATTLAKQSHIPRRNLTLVSREGTYAHNDPAAAYPKNAFFDKLVPFLGKIGAERSSSNKRHR